MDLHCRGCCQSRGASEVFLLLSDTIQTTYILSGLSMLTLLRKANVVCLIRQN